MQQEEVVRRRSKCDSRFRQRRGSIKSRILQFGRKRKKEPPDKFSDNEESDSAFQSKPFIPRPVRALPTLVEQDLESLEVEIHDSGPPIKREYDTTHGLLVLEEPSVRYGEQIPENVGLVSKVSNGSDLTQSADKRPTYINIKSQNDTVNNEANKRRSCNDYSFVSSCSLPSGITAASTPSSYHQPVSHPLERKVVLRRSCGAVINNTTESGRLLNSALARHFRSLHCNGIKLDSETSATILSDNLFGYIKDVFIQLRSPSSDVVSREDFEALCEILKIDKSPPLSKRNSGLEWLSSYSPRPNTPASPILVDKISEAKFKHNGPKPPEKDPTSFLWTIGSRPFWELWPYRKYKKKNLNLEEFTQCLCDQWAQTHGYPLVKVNTSDKTLDKTCLDKKNEIPNLDHQDKSRIDRLKRSIARLTKRHHKLSRIPRNQANISNQSSRVLSNNGSVNGGINGHSAAHVNGYENGIDRIAVQSNGHQNGITPHNNINFRRSKSSFFSSSKRTKQMEHRMCEQQKEIESLRDVIDHLRSSLQLSDAQNLALQVLLKRMAKAEAKLPSEEPGKINNHIKQSEKQLECLISELKEMSETKYPTIPRNLYSGSPSSMINLDQGIEEELEKSKESISEVQKDLTSANMQLRDYSKQLQNKETNKEDLNMKIAYKALLKAELEIEKLRSNVLEAQSSLEYSQSELVNTKKDLKETKQTLFEKSKKLSISEKRISQLYENRKSLLSELKSTKDILISSLKNVQDLEVESRKVPQLESRIEKLEMCLQNKSFLSSSSETDQDEIDFKIHDQSAADSEILFGASANQCLPPRPPSVRSNEKSGRTETPSSEKDVFSPTPSSGHYSAGSTSFLSKSPGDKADSVIPRLRSEIDHLKKRFSQSEKEWAEERNTLLLELQRNSEIHGESYTIVEDLREERLRLGQIEEKIKEILKVLKSLNSMKVSNDVLGKLVIDAVEKAYDDVKGEVQVFKFLNILYLSSRDYERQSADSLLTDALDAIKDSNSDSSDSLGNVPEGMKMIQPRRPASNIQDSKMESLYRIDV